MLKLFSFLLGGEGFFSFYFLLNAIFSRRYGGILAALDIYIYICLLYTSLGT